MTGLFGFSKKTSYSNTIMRFTNSQRLKGRLQLQNSLVHFSHRNLESMLYKTLLFTEYEVDLRVKNGHPPIVVWRFIRVMFTEFWTRFIKLGAWRDGVEGVIDGIFQV